jgi:hypothetical protein
MNSASGNTASNSFEKPGAHEPILSLTTCRQMLPLVQRIVHDIIDARCRLNSLEAELATLDRQKRTLNWPSRYRRYELQETVREHQHSLQDGLAELEMLGVAIFDDLRGLVGFPTQVNGRRAYFSWKSGELELRCWHFAGDAVRRQIPASWKEELRNTAVKS